MESVWVEVQARCEEIELISLPVVPRPLAPKSRHTGPCRFPEHTVHLLDSRSLLMLFPLPGILSSFHPSLISLANTYLSRLGSNITSSGRLFKVLCMRRDTFLWFPRVPEPAGHTAGKALSRCVRIYICWMEGQMTE